jgi:hypothetical protein
MVSNTISCFCFRIRDRWDGADLFAKICSSIVSVCSFKFVHKSQSIPSTSATNLTPFVQISFHSFKFCHECHFILSNSFIHRSLFFPIHFQISVHSLKFVGIFQFLLANYMITRSEFLNFPLFIRPSNPWSALFSLSSQSKNHVFSEHE